MALDEQNAIVSFGRNRSGMYSGELDYSIRGHLMDKLSNEDTAELARLLGAVQRRCFKTMYAKGMPTPLYYRIYRIIDITTIKDAFSRKDYVMWPITVKWGQFKATTPYITAHGFQIGWDKGDRVFGWTLHLGRLKIIFGKDKRK